MLTILGAESTVEERLVSTCGCNASMLRGTSGSSRILRMGS